MQRELRRHGTYGTLEQWTVALFALSFILPLVILAIVCLIFAKYWTVTEKLVAFFAPVLIFVALISVVSATMGIQDWILIPTAGTVSGLTFIFSAAFLSTRGRVRDARTATAS